ncbi:MAG TPA: DUF3579 domain-containing protein [Gallionella sp.]|nr:DUF3579 domain-containing protein [Gallionella sp.]
MFREQQEWVILGVTEAGEVFDVAGWAERLCGMLANQGRDNRVNYSDYLTPAHIEGLPAVVMLSRLEQDDPASFAVVRQFVAENRLKTRSGRSGSATGKHPVLLQERRSYIKG